MKTTLALVALVLVALVLLGAHARADVLPPEELCLPHQVWHQSHGGGCVDRAPSDCENGWRGVIRGQCIVHLAQDGACPDGLKRREASVCFMTYDDHGSGRVRYDPPRATKLPLGYATDAETCPKLGLTTETAAVCVDYDEAPTPWVGTRYGHGPRRPSLVDYAQRSACAGGGVALGLMAALALLTRRVLRAR